MSIDITGAFTEAWSIANSIAGPLVEEILPILLGLSLTVFVLGIFFGIPLLLKKLKVF
jgi:hypothetical protein